MISKVAARISYSIVSSSKESLRNYRIAQSRSVFLCAVRATSIALNAIILLKLWVAIDMFPKIISFSEELSRTLKFST
jgi:hypothetical protein